MSFKEEWICKHHYGVLFPKINCNHTDDNGNRCTFTQMQSVKIMSTITINTEQNDNNTKIITTKTITRDKDISEFQKYDAIINNVVNTISNFDLYNVTSWPRDWVGKYSYNYLDGCICIDNNIITYQKYIAKNMSAIIAIHEELRNKMKIHSPWDLLQHLIRKGFEYKSDMIIYKEQLLSIANILNITINLRIIVPNITRAFEQIHAIKEDLCITIYLRTTDYHYYNGDELKDIPKDY